MTATPIRVRYQAGDWVVHTPDRTTTVGTRREAIAVARRHADTYGRIELQDPRHDTWRTIPG